MELCALVDSCCLSVSLCRPNIQDMARQMQENNPSMYEQLQQEATRFRTQAAAQQGQAAEDGEKEEKKEG